jgi:hypothetical protein
LCVLDCCCCCCCCCWHALHVAALKATSRARTTRLERCILVQCSVTGISHVRLLVLDSDTNAQQQCWRHGPNPCKSLSIQRFVDDSRWFLHGSTPLETWQDTYPW